MENQFENLYNLIKEFAKKIALILDLKNGDFNAFNFSEISDFCNMPKEVPGVMLTPYELALINKGIYDNNKHFEQIPTVVINDCFQFGSKLQLLGTIAHELRHVWQYYNMYGAKDEFKNHVKPETTEYYNQQHIEKDAYAFQLVVIKALAPSSTINEVFVHFKNIKSTIEHLNRNYKKKIISVFKGVKL